MNKNTTDSIKQKEWEDTRNLKQDTNWTNKFVHTKDKNLTNIEKYFNFLNFFTFNKEKKVNYNEIMPFSTTIYALLNSAFKSNYKSNVTSNNWLNRDYLFNAKNSLNLMNENLNYISEKAFGENIIEENPDSFSGKDIVAKAVGTAYKQKKDISYFNKNIYSNNIYIYLDLNVLIDSVPILKYVLMEKITNIVLLCSITDKDDAELYHHIQNRFKHRFNFYVASGASKIQRKLKKSLANKNNKSSIIFIKNNEFNSNADYHSNFVNTKKIFTKNEIEEMIKDYDFSLEELEKTKIPEYINNFFDKNKTKTKKRFNDWGEKYHIKNTKVKPKPSKLIPRSILKQRLQKSEIKTLKDANERIMNRIVLKNPNFTVTRSLNLTNILLNTRLDITNVFLKTNISNCERLINRLRYSEFVGENPIVIIEYKNSELDSVNFTAIKENFYNSFKNVFNVANLNELLEFWSIAQIHKGVNVLFLETSNLKTLWIDELVKNKNDISRGGYIIKKPNYPSKPISKIFIASGYMVNELDNLLKLAKIPSKNNIQIISLPNKNILFENKEYYNKLINSNNVEKIWFRLTGLNSKTIMYKINNKLSVIKIPTNVIKTKNHSKILKSVKNLK